MNIQLDIIDLIKNLELELNNKLYTLATRTYWKWRELLASVENDYMYELLEKLYRRTARRFERLSLVGGV